MDLDGRTFEFKNTMTAPHERFDKSFGVGTRRLLFGRDDLSLPFGAACSSWEFFSHHVVSLSEHLLRSRLAQSHQHVLLRDLLAIMCSTWPALSEKDGLAVSRQKPHKSQRFKSKSHMEEGLAQANVGPFGSLPSEGMVHIVGAATGGGRPTHLELGSYLLPASEHSGFKKRQSWLSRTGVTRVLK